MDIAAKTDALFQTITKEDGKEYTYREVAKRSDDAFSSTTVWKVRTGQIKNPSFKVLKGICKAFGVPITYYTDESASEESIPKYQAKRYHKQMTEQILRRAHQLDANGKKAVLDMVNYILKLQEQSEGSDESTEQEQDMRR